MLQVAVKKLRIDIARRKKYGYTVNIDLCVSSFGEEGTGYA